MQSADDYDDELPQQEAAVSQAAAAQASPVLEQKHCCICGYDLTKKKRHKDRADRYWCVPCFDFLGPPTDKLTGTIRCLDCGRETPKDALVDRAGEMVCRPCGQIYTAELENCRLRKIAVAANPELAIRRLIRKMTVAIIAIAALSLLLTLYHFGLLGVRPRDWVPFLWPLYIAGSLVIVALAGIASQRIRIAIRQRGREVAYDEQVREAVNRVLALGEESHSQGIVERAEPLRRQAERIVGRVEAAAGQGVAHAEGITTAMSKNGNPVRLIEFLKSQRPGTNDTVARNREISTITYLQGDWDAAMEAITAVLLRLPQDQDAMTRLALIYFRKGDFEEAKKIFKRVMHIAREKNSELDTASAYSNLGMLHMLLEEIDDAEHRHLQSLGVYTRLGREDGQADCQASLGFIDYKRKLGEAAEKRFRKALEINLRMKRPEGMATCYGILGVLVYEKEGGNLNEAERMLYKAIALNEDLRRLGGVATAYGNLGLIRAKRKDFKAARELLQKAQGIYQRINRPKMVAKIQAMLRTLSTVQPKG